MTTRRRSTKSAPPLCVVLTGSCEDGELLHTLEARGSGIDVLAHATAVLDVVEQLEAPELKAVLHRMTWAEGSVDPALTLSEDVTEIRARTSAPIVLLVTQATSSLVEAALAAGVDDVLMLPQPAEMIAFAIHKAGKASRLSPSRAEGEAGQVITVFSPKGGTGKTVLSTNLAAVLASKTRKRVLLIDLDLQFGDAAIMLGLDPKRTMYELVVDPGDLDPDKLAAYTTRHRSGLDVLVAPMFPEHAELVTEEKVLKLIEVAREAYDLVVIDTSPFFYGPMLALLGPTDHLLLLCGLDVPTLKNVRLSLRTLELLGFSAERTNIVLNRVTADVGLTTTDVEAALGVRVAYEVPNDPVVAPAVNRGAVPALYNESEFGTAVAAIADALVPDEAAPQQAATPVEVGTSRRRRFVPWRVAEGRA